MKITSQRVRMTLVAHALAMAFSGPAFAQSNATGTIFGQVANANGASVVLADISDAEHVAHDLRNKGLRASATRLDVSDEASVQNMRVRRVLLDSVKRVIESKPPVGVGIDLRGVSAVDAELADGGAWQSLVPSHREAVSA